MSLWEVIVNAKFRQNCTGREESELETYMNESQVGGNQLISYFIQGPCLLKHKISNVKVNAPHRKL